MAAAFFYIYIYIHTFSVNITVTKVYNFSPSSRDPKISNTCGIPTLQVFVSTVFFMGHRKYKHKMLGCLNWHVVLTKFHENCLV
jgi:hypothetical protein